MAAYSLKKVDIGESVREIKSNAFINCNSVEAYYIRNINPVDTNFRSNIGYFSGVNGFKIYVPSDMVNIYQERLSDKKGIVCASPK